MRVGIISDTHDRLQRAVRAIQTLVDAGAQAIFHCGDLTTPDLVHACGVLPSYYVLGNNDYQESALRAAIEAVDGHYLGLGGTVQLAGKAIAMTHGHDFRRYDKLIREQPNYLLFGHFHVPLDERDGQTRKINPGALHRAEQYTVAVLDLATDNLQFLVIDK